MRTRYNYHSPREIRDVVNAENRLRWAGLSLYGSEVFEHRPQRTHGEESYRYGP